MTGPTPERPAEDGATLCRHCRQRIVKVNYAMGPSWTHQHAGAAFQDGMHQFCHMTLAEPRAHQRLDCWCGNHHAPGDFL